MAIAQSIERKSNDRSILPVLQSPERSFYPAKLDSQTPTRKHQGQSHCHYYRKKPLRRIAGYSRCRATPPKDATVRSSEPQRQSLNCRRRHLLAIA